MPRQKIHQNNAAKCLAYRVRRKEAGLPSLHRNDLERVIQWRIDHPLEYKEQRKRHKKKAHQKKRETKMFIAIDGEGITKNDKKNLYHYERNGEEKSIGTHYYTLMGDSNGRFIENYREGLSTKECLDFLLSTDNNAILVGFAINYDVNMLLRDLSQDELELLWKTGEVVWEDYKIIWMPSKMLIVSKGTVHRVWYDVFGYFQKSFIKALTDMGFDVPKEITEGKEDRKTFTNKQKDKIRKYNLMECELLVKMMDKLRQAFIKADMLPNKWYGAGTLASVLCERYGIRHYNATPNEIKSEIVSAYYGGRNQILLQGEIGDCYIHDINSAYPSAMADLPTAIGEWEEISIRKPSDSLCSWTLCYTEWDLPESVLVTPFPFRYKGRIYWPHKGKGWYWSPEVFSAYRHFGNKIKVTKAYQFYPEDDSKPFDFIPELYEKRKQLIKEGNDAELAIKLGLNSMYGKAAQSIGFRDALPAYQNYFWAGYITSVTRSKIFELAQTVPKDIVFFSTDGVVSKSQLVEGSKEKNLGEWDVKRLTNFFALQSGVYTFDSGNGVKYKSRGFNYKSVDYDNLRRVWQKEGNKGTHSYDETRFVGLGIALKGDFNLWRRWEIQNREINFEATGIAKKENGCYRIIPPVMPDGVEESERYKLKGNWFTEGDGMEYLSLLDSQI
jgi:hypothetical protein